jgi:hypothetical protein
LNELAENKTPILIDKLFGVFPIDEKNSFIKRIIPLLPLASEIRSNKMIWRDILKNVFYPARVDIRIIEKPDAAGLMRSVVRATIYIEKLSTWEFKKTKKDVDVFAHFFYEWFIPADMGCEFKVKDKNEPFVLGKTITLDYNTYFS